MKNTRLGISFGQFYSIFIHVMLLIMVSTFAMQKVESSRPVFVDDHHHMMIKIAKAYSGPSKSGTGHADAIILHKVLPKPGTSFDGFKMTMAYSGPSRKGAGHGLSNLVRKNFNSTSFKRFNQAYSGPSDSGTGH